jgi:hypothetical protein
MKTVSIEEVQTGMRLAVDLQTASGTFVLGKGAVLTEPLLARLRRMDVSALAVDADDGPAEDFAPLQRQLAQRFSGTENDEWLAEIRRIAEDHLRMRCGVSPQPLGEPPG